MGIGKLGGGVVSGVRDMAQHITNPQAIADRQILSLFGSDPNALAKLRTAQQFVPGETPSAAQVIATPDAVKAERLLRNNPNAGIPLAEADNTNNAARQAVVTRLAGTDAEMEAAKAARRDATQPFIDEHLKPATPLTRWTAASAPLDALLSKPGRMPTADFDALKQARALVAKVRGGTMQEDDATAAMQELADSVTTKKAQSAFSEAFGQVDKNMIDPAEVLRAVALTRNTGLGARPAVRDALDKIAATINQSKNTRGLVPADVLDSIRQNANDFLVSPSGKRASAQEALGVAPIRDKIVSVIGRHAPGYSDYLAAYAKGSEPINTMQSVGRLADSNAPGGPNTAGDPQLAISRLRQVLRGDDKARFSMSGDARGQLDGLQQSLLRRTITNNQVAASGPATAADL